MQQTPASFSDFLNNFVTYFIPISTMFFAWFYAVLKEPDTKAEYISKLKKFHFLPFYRYWLKNILDKIDNYLGKPKFSTSFIFKNIMFHYGFAIFYVFVVFIIVWLLGGSGKLGALKILPAKDSFLDRGVVVFGLIAGFFIFYFVFKLSDKLDIYNEKLNNLFERIFNIDGRIIHRVVSSIIAFVVAYFISKNIILSIFSLILFFILYQIVVVLLLGVVVGGVGAAAIVVGGGVGIFSLLNGNNFLNANNASLLIFLILIPFLNAILDFVSLTISRYFSRKIANGESLFLILFHLLLDLVLAIVFFVGLAYILYYGVELFNILVDKKLQIPIGKMLVDAIKEPFALKNAWITFMLFSTLIPTLLHILLALVSFLLQITNLSPFYAKLIEESELRETKKIKATLFMTVPTSMIFISMLYGIYRLYLLFV